MFTTMTAKTEAVRRMSETVSELESQATESYVYDFVRQVCGWAYVTVEILQTSVECLMTRKKAQLAVLGYIIEPVTNPFGVQEIARLRAEEEMLNLIAKQPITDLLQVRKIAQSIIAHDRDSLVGLYHLLTSGTPSQIAYAASYIKSTL